MIEEKPAALRVLSEAGWGLLVDAGIAVDDAPDALRAAEHLRHRRPEAPPDERAAALELVTEGLALAKKLGLDQRLLAVRGAVEQATSVRVATWHAQQLPADARVLEIGCGCGADSLALAHRAQNLMATDIDPVRAACAHTNLMAFGLASARALPADGLEVLAGEGRRANVVFADPDRRPGGRRTLDPERWEPPLSRLLALADGERSVFVKAAPSLSADEVPAPFDVAYVSFAGACVEAFLSAEPGRAPRAPRAVLLPPEGPSVELAGDRGDAPAGPLGAVLLVADPAAIRARLLAELCSRHELRLVNSGLAFLTGESAAQSPWLTAYRVIESLPLHPRHVRHAVRRLGPRQLRVHARGVAITAPDLDRPLRGERGSGPELDVFATRSDDRPIAVLAERVGPAP